MPRKNSTDKQLPAKAGRSDRAAARTKRTATRKWKKAPLLEKPTNPTIRLGQDQPERELEHAVDIVDAAMEMVNHPAHYGGDTPHEVIKYLEAWGLESDALLWNAVKYIARYRKKFTLTVHLQRELEGLQDLEKARFYLDRRIQQLQRANAEKLQPTK